MRMRRTQRAKTTLRLRLLGTFVLFMAVRLAAIQIHLTKRRRRKMMVSLKCDPHHIVIPPRSKDRDPIQKYPRRPHHPPLQPHQRLRHHHLLPGVTILIRRLRHAILVSPRVMQAQLHTNHRGGHHRSSEGHQTFMSPLPPLHLRC